MANSHLLSSALQWEGHLSLPFTVIVRMNHLALTELQGRLGSGLNITPTHPNMSQVFGGYRTRTPPFSIHYQ